MKKLIFGFIIVLTMLGCKSFKNKTLLNEVNQDEIQIAIEDFSKTWKFLSKKNKVYVILTHKALNDTNVIIVHISENNTKILLTNKTVIGSIGEMPSKYVLKNGNLFYWWDKNFALTEEALSVFKKFNLLQDDMGGTIRYPDNYIDEKSKSSIYYFCKKNIKIHEKIITNKGKYFDHAPIMKCD